MIVPSRSYRDIQHESGVDSGWPTSVCFLWGLLTCAVLVAALYPMQLNREWGSSIFPAPAHLNVDSPEWMSIVDTKPFLSNTLPMHVSRPLYPLPAFALKQYVLPQVRALAMLRWLNVLWLAVGAAGLFWWTLYWTGNIVAGGVSMVLLCVSPCVQIYLSQPVPTIIGNAVSVVPLALVAWAARVRIGVWQWVGAGALSALLILGKEVYSVYLCLFLVAVWHRAWKPMVCFAAPALVVHVAWLAWVHWGLALKYDPYGANQQGFMSWIGSDFVHRTFVAQVAFLVRLLARMVVHSLQAFEVWPILLAGAGWVFLHRKPRAEMVSYLAAFFVMFFAMNLVTPRICFLIYPCVYPLAAVAIVRIGERAWGRSKSFGALWIGVVCGLVAASALIDPYRFFYYG